MDDPIKEIIILSILINSYSSESRLGRRLIKSSYKAIIKLKEENGISDKDIENYKKVMKL